MNPETSFSDLRHFCGHPGRFWPAFLQEASRQAGASACLLLAGKSDADTWKRLYAWTGNDQAPPLIDTHHGLAAELAGTAVQTGGAWAALPETAAGEARPVLLALPLQEEHPEPRSVAVFLLDNPAADQIEPVLAGLRLVADTPAVYQRQRAAHRALRDMAAIGESFDLMILLNAEQRFLAAAMTLVNEVSSRHRCSRVSLGWLEKGYVRLQAISHMERFEKKMDIVASLEAAMEEALDQDEEIVWPQDGSGDAVVRDHQHFAREQNIQTMVSLPIRLDGESVGVLSCERQQSPFGEDDIRALRILCDQAGRRLGDLKKVDRGFGARLADGLRGWTSTLLGVEHTLAKAAALLGFALLAFALLGQLPYRVEAPFILRSEDVRQVSVPFEGYIDAVHVKIGQQVRQGDPLLALDTDDLLLEESAAIANQIRYLREAEKARARGALGDMQVAQAQAAQAQAQLDLVRYRLDQAQLRSPIDGIVVEGDLEELSGAPVSKGDILFKVARNENLFAELKVNERDIHELAVGHPGEIAFVSQPQVTFRVNVQRIDPVAQAGEEGNLFMLRGTTEAPARWWRPGMSGIAKIEVGRRRIAWILTHRTLDYLRLLLWW